MVRLPIFAARLTRSVRRRARSACSFRSSDGRRRSSSIFYRLSGKASTGTTASLVVDRDPPGRVLEEKENCGKTCEGIRQVADSCWKGNASAADRTRVGSAWRGDHGVLQAVQRAHAVNGGSDRPRPDNCLRRPLVLFCNENTTGR